MSLLESYIGDLAPLVNIDCGTGSPAGVTRVGEVVMGYCEAAGLHAEAVDLGSAVGKGVFAANKPGAKHFDVLLSAHLDTVFPDGTAAARPFTVKGDRAWGPGCSDCKGGLLSAIYAIKTARPEDLERLAIAVAFNPDEEKSSTHSRDWLASIAKKCSRALVFEAARAGGELVRRRKGVSRLAITFKGVASHAGNAPYEGANANIAAMRFGLAAAGLSDALKGTTVNPGIIRGGKASNVIPERCEMILDLRYWSNGDGDALASELESLAVAKWAPRVSQDWTWQNRGPAMPYSEASAGLVDAVTEAARMAGFEAKWVDAGGGSDGNRIAVHGIPVVDGCGPAGGGFHSDAEFLRLDTVEERIRMVANFLSLI